MFYSLALAVALLGARVRANGKNGVFFLYPQGGETFYSTDVVNVTYRSPINEPHLILWCGTKGGGVSGGNPREYWRTAKAPGPNAWILVPMNFTDIIDVCWFNLRPVANYYDGYPGPFGDNSGNFVQKIAEPGRPVATLSLPDTANVTTIVGTLNVPASTSPPNISTRTDPVAKPTAASGQSNVPSVPDSLAPSGGGGGGLGTGAIVGLAVGLALLTAIVAGGIGVACWLRRQKRRKAAARLVEHQEYPSDKGQPPSTGDANGYQHSQTSTMPPQMLSDPYAQSQWSAGSSPPTSNAQPSTQSPGTTVSELHSPAGTAELPTRGVHGLGNEHEMAAQAAAPPPAKLPSTRDNSEGKFLLQDVLATKLQQQPPAELEGSHVVRETAQP